MADGILSVAPASAAAAGSATLPSDGGGRVAPGAGFVAPGGVPVQDVGLALTEMLPHKPGSIEAPKTPATVEATTAPAATPAVNAAEPGNTEPAAKDAQSGTQDATATAPDGKTPETAVAGDYAQLKVPDGYQTSAEAMTQFREFAAKAKLSADAAQAIIDFDATRQKAAISAHEQMTAQQDTEWIDTIRKDPELGGEKLLPNLKAARDAMTRFGSEPLFKFLKATGLDNHPELVRVFTRIGHATADDRTDAPSRSGGPSKAAWDDYSDLYPELQQGR